MRKSPVPSPAHGVELHDLAVGGLGEGIDRDEATAVLEPHPIVAAFEVVVHELAQHVDRRFAHALLLGDEPLLEVRAVLDDEVAQEVAAIELRGVRELVGVDLLPAMSTLDRQIESLDVDPVRWARIKAQCLSLGEDEVGVGTALQRRAEVVEGLPEPVAGVRLLLLGPEQTRDVRAAEGAPTVADQIGQKSSRFLRFEPLDLQIVAPDLENPPRNLNFSLLTLARSPFSGSYPRSDARRELGWTSTGCLDWVPRLGASTGMPRLGCLDFGA